MQVIETIIRARSNMHALQLLPPHLHDEIDSTTYFTPTRHHARSLSANDQRYMLDSPSLSASSKLSAYSLSPPTQVQHTVVMDQAPPPPQPQQQYVPQQSRQILPSIRDLQSVADSNMQTSPASAPAGYADRRPNLSRPGSFGQDYPTPPYMDTSRSYNLMSPTSLTNGDRTSTDPYATDAGTPYIRAQSYPYVSAVHQDLEPPTPRSLPPHSQHSSFGVIGDATDSKAKRRRGNLPKPVTDILRAWFHEHLDHPYPTEEDKQMFMSRTGLTLSQVSWHL